MACYRRIAQTYPEKVIRIFTIMRYKGDELEKGEFFTPYIGEVKYDPDLDQVWRTG
jgi:hypothetical protein